MTICRAHRNADGIYWPVVVSVDKPFYGQVALGNMTQKAIGAFWIDNEHIFVGVEGWGAYTFRFYAHHTYIMEKFCSVMEGDARNLADWINAQLGIEGKMQGGYDLGLWVDDI